MERLTIFCPDLVVLSKLITISPSISTSPSHPVKINPDLNTDNRVDIGAKIASLPLNFGLFWANNPVKAVYSLI
jgi:hypothetical protein